MSRISNFLGGFADAAVLLPIMALLSGQAGFSSSRLFISAGLLYITSAWFFKIPMAVQPLKSIAISAIALEASDLEIRAAALGLGIFCVVLTFWDVESLAKRVPIAIVHQIQVGLGVLLIMQGFKASSHMGVMLAALGILAFPRLFGIPLMGMVALLGFIGSAFTQIDPVLKPASNLLRPELILTLLLPQLALTLSNSVLGTRNACEAYFGDRASQVTLKNLLLSIGVGNCLSALVGGLPFCHGSGGVTAHVKSGATKAWSTALFGVFLIVFSFKLLVYPPVLMAFLLMTTGLFHLQLGFETSKFKLGLAITVTILTGNLLFVLLTAILGELISNAYLHRSLAYSQAKRVFEEPRS